MFSKALKKAIIASGQSVNAIAKGAGVTQPALCNFVNDKRGLTLESADKLAAYLGLEVKQKRTARRVAARQRS